MFFFETHLSVSKVTTQLSQSGPKVIQSHFYTPKISQSDPNVTRLARLQTFFGAVAAPLTFKICRRNGYKLLMGPFGSDQSRHVDDFGAKMRNVDDFVANKSSF